MSDLGKMWLQREIREAAKEVMDERAKAQTPAPVAKTAPPRPRKSSGKPTTPARAPQARKPARKAPQAPAYAPVQVSIEDVPERPDPVVPPRRAKTIASDQPESPCVVCGGAASGPQLWGVWRRHHSCEVLHVDPVARTQAAARGLGFGALSRTDAALLPVSVPCYTDTHPEPTYATESRRDRLPWRHVDRKAMRKAIDRLPELRAEAGVDPVRCTAGACGWCGVAVALRWQQVDHLTWRDGTEAALCGDCYAVYVRHSEPSFPDEVRLALSERITGVVPQMGETPPDGLRPYVEVAGDDRDGGEPWAHLNADAVRSYRFTVWSRFNFAYCPAEHRDEVRAWAAARDRERAAEAAARETAEAERRNTHGFDLPE